MKKSFLGLILFGCISVLHAQDLGYYLPDSVRYDPAVPKPKDIIHHEVGEWHVTHDRLVNYMQAIAKAAPSRVKIETMGYTYEGRPQVLLVFTSPALPVYSRISGKPSETIFINIKPTPA